MKIKKIHINNVLSYGDESVEFNNDLNIFVGANGSGKSNLINIIIYILKKYCFRNYDISTNYGIEHVGLQKYSIRQKNPLYNSNEDYFFQKHKNKETEKSFIDLVISFEEQDYQNLLEIKAKKDIICTFIEKQVDNIHLMENRFQIDKMEAVKIFDIERDDLNIGANLVIKIKESDHGWIIDNELDKYYLYMKYFSLMCDILNLIGSVHNIKNPFVFFEAYRNNSSETTKVGLSQFDNGSYTNLQSWQNLLSLNYSIGTNSTYIMLATKKYGKIMRNMIEQKDGLDKFYNSDEYINLKNYFKKFEYDINLKCISPENNIYQFYIIRDNLSIEIDTISSGEREIINFIFGLFLEQLNDGIVIIDEPELHLHPNWQKKLIQILKEETSNKNVQILFVTHSSSFISYNILNNIYRVYKKSGYSKCLRVNDLYLNDVQNEFRRNLSIINATNNEKIFFSKAVILVEGITDEILFKKIYEKENGSIDDGVEFVSISGKNNFENFKYILDKLDIQYFYIGDLDNIFEFSELDHLFSVNIKAQIKDLKRNKNQSYSCLDLLHAIDELVNDNNYDNYKKLVLNYSLYNQKFKDIRNNLTNEEKIELNNFINNKYDENIYILKQGEIENYLGTGNTNKALGFKKVISIINDENEYEDFKSSLSFAELQNIIKDIKRKLGGNTND